MHCTMLFIQNGSNNNCEPDTRTDLLLLCNRVFRSHELIAGVGVGVVTLAKTDLHVRCVDTEFPLNVLVILIFSILFSFVTI